MQELGGHVLPFAHLSRRTWGSRLAFCSFEPDSRKLHHIIPATLELTLPATAPISSCSSPSVRIIDEHIEITDVIILKLKK